MTPRDVEIIHAVADHRALSSTQIERLFFRRVNSERGAVNSRCALRLRLLFQHEYLDRDEQATTYSLGPKPLVYFLGRRGAQLLELGKGERELGILTAGHLFLRHLLNVNDIRIACSLSAREHQVEIEKWIDDKALKGEQMKDYVTLTNKNRQQRAAVVPDGYFVVGTTDKRFHFFLEADLGTVNGISSIWGRRDFARKIRAYIAYRDSGKYERRYGTTDMRVLVVTTSEKRMLNLKSVTETVGGKRRFWFTTLGEVAKSDFIFSPIWRVASQQELQSLL